MVGDISLPRVEQVDEPASIIEGFAHDLRRKSCVERAKFGQGVQVLVALVGLRVRNHGLQNRRRQSLDFGDTSIELAGFLDPVRGSLQDRRTGFVDEGMHLTRSFQQQRERACRPEWARSFDLLSNATFLAECARYLQEQMGVVPLLREVMDKPAPKGQVLTFPIADPRCSLTERV